VVDFDYPVAYDLILLFGVVTHLEPGGTRESMRRAARGLADTGVLAVKNQSSRTAEKRVDGYSETLKCHYVGRYPDIPGQLSRLKRVFRDVTTHPYPGQFNKWPETTHVCFLCSGRI
jgi:hypothetical protein